MSTRILPLNVDIPLTINVVDNDGVAVPISPTAVVKVAIGRPDFTETFATYTADKDEDDADWSAGVVVVPVDAEDTVDIHCLKLATEVDIDGTKYRGVHLLETTRVLIP